MHSKNPLILLPWGLNTEVDVDFRVGQRALDELAHVLQARFEPANVRVPQSGAGRLGQFASRGTGAAATTRTGLLVLLPSLCT